METENLIGVYLKLLSVLECPVCLEYLTKPVAMCNEGHALCSKCKSSISSGCPLCRSPISSTRGLILDQIIETLLYPCYKMGCGSLLKRSDAESHDLNCTLENAPDKQAVLHNNLLKNIEENFGSFIVQPEIIKETRTVGTVTGRVKTADARVQTALPFSSSLLLEKVNSSTPTGCSSPLSGYPKTGPTTGISIRSNEQSPNTTFKAADLSSLAFSFPQTSSFNQNGLGFSFNPESYPENLNFKFSLEPFQNNGCLSKDVYASAYGPYTKPFMFGIENNSGGSSKNSSKKPSTNLNFTMESGPTRRECEQGTSNDFFIRNEGIPFANLSFPSSDSMDISNIPSSSSFPGPLAPKLSRGDSDLENKNSKNKPSTNLTSCSSLVNSVSSNNVQAFVAGDSIMAPAQRKRPSTNLCGLTSLA